MISGKTGVAKAGWLVAALGIALGYGCTVSAPQEFSGEGVAGSGAVAGSDARPTTTAGSGGGGVGGVASRGNAGSSGDSSLPLAGGGNTTEMGDGGAAGAPPSIPPTEACAGQTPGYRYCDGLKVMACDDDLASVTPIETCQQQACVDGACIGECAPAATRCTAGGAETCSASGQWSTAQACLNQACLDGKCSGNCAPDTKKCDGLVPSTCSAAGEWVAAPACDKLCSGGACSGTCAPNAKTCNGQVPQTCDALATWQDGTPCSNQACVSGACVGTCAPQAKRCSGNGVQTCSANGTWGSAAACVDQACVSGSCGGECAPGAKQCSGNGVQTCSGTGSWGSAVDCSNKACVSGACVGECTPGTKQCSGNGVQSCLATGFWGSASACNSQACVSGSCTGACTPGSKQCSNNGVQTCSNAGSWGSAVDCSNMACVSGACIGNCGPGADRCVTSPERRQSCDSNGSWTTLETCASGSVCVESNGTTCLKQAGQPCTSPGQCVSNVCSTFCADVDADGYGNLDSSVRVCGSSPPSGYTANKEDCCDGEPLAFPGQSQYFDAPRAGCGGYDYDCDGISSKNSKVVVDGVEVTSKVAVMTCQTQFNSCDFASAGWNGSIPACGSVTPNWITACSYQANPTPHCGVSVKIFPAQPVQTCR